MIRALLLLLIVSILSSGVEISKLEEDDREFLQSLDAFTASSTFCSQDFISNFERQLLGHMDNFLPIATSYFLSTISCKNILECTSIIWRDFLISMENQLDITKGEGDYFYFTKPHNMHDHNSDSSWKILLVGGGKSKLPVYEISASGKKFFAKFYPFPAAADALNAEMISMYAIAQLPSLQYVTGSRSLLIKKCLVGTDAKPYFVTLARGAKGTSLADLISPKNPKEQVNNAIFLAFRALGDFQAISSKVKSQPPEVFLPSSQTIEFFMYSKLQDEIADKKQLQQVIQTESELLTEIKKIIKNDPEYPLNSACYSHFDLGIGNIFIDTTTNLVTFIDALSLYLSVNYFTENSRISCKDNNFATTPYYNFLPRSHGAYDYFYLLIYLKLSYDDPSVPLLAKQGYCAGRFKHSKELIESCTKLQLWPEQIELFFQRMVILHLSPKVYATRFAQGINSLPQNVPSSTPTPSPSVESAPQPPKFPINAPPLPPGVPLSILQGRNN